MDERICTEAAASPVACSGAGWIAKPEYAFTPQRNEGLVRTLKHISGKLSSESPDA